MAVMDAHVTRHRGAATCSGCGKGLARREERVYENVCWRGKRWQRGNKGYTFITRKERNLCSFVANERRGEGGDLVHTLRESSIADDCREPLVAVIHDNPTAESPIKNDTSQREVETVSSPKGGRMLSAEEAHIRRRRALCLAGSSCSTSSPQDPSKSRRQQSWACSPATRRRHHEDETKMLLQKLTSLRTAFGGTGSAGVVTHSRWQEAVALVDSARGRGRPLSTAIYNEFLLILSRAGQLKHAEDAFQLMFKDGIRRSEKTFTIMIEAYGRRKMACLALKTFNRMLDEGLEPGATAYIAALSACGARQRKSVRTMDAMRIYESMKEMNIQPTARTFVPLLRLFRQTRKRCEASYQYSLTLIRDMKEFDVRMTPHLVSQLALTFAHFLLKDELRDLLNVVLSGSHDKLLDAVTCSSLLRAARYLDDPAILHETLHKILKKNIESDLILHYTIVYTYALLEETDQAKTYIDSLLSSADPAVKIISKNLLVQGSWGKKASLDEAFDGKLPETLVGYNVLIDTVWEFDSQTEAVQLVGRAIERGIFRETFSKRNENESFEITISLLGLSPGAAQAVIIFWMNYLSANVDEICDTNIVIGWGMKAPFLLQKQFQGVSSLLAMANSPFHRRLDDNPAVYTAKADEIKFWLKTDKAERFGVDWLLY